MAENDPPEVNPHTQVVPDFGSEAFAFLRQALINTEQAQTDEEAIQSLVTSWTVQNDAKKAAWDARHAGNGNDQPIPPNGANGGGGAAAGFRARTWHLASKKK